jgi:Putative prokaryotic signal transducing protein
VRWPWRRRPSPERLQLVKVAYARNIAEAEMIQDRLRQEGIPSMVRRNGGFDVPDFLAAGPRDVLVSVSQADRAREALS